MNALKLIFVYTFLMCGLAVFGYPHNREVFKLQQPDGSKVEVLVWGDEFYQHIESPEGHTLVRDPGSDYICYAELSATGTLVSTGIPYKSEEVFVKSALLPPKGLKESKTIIQQKIQKNRMQLGVDQEPVSSFIALKSISPSIDGRYRISTGKVKGITILIDFDDEEATIPRNEISDMLNKKGYTGYGNNGSVYDYFYDMSAGKLELTQNVVGYYRAPKPKSYYDNPELEGYDHVDELLRDILDKVDIDYILNQYTTLGYYLVSVNFMYAGEPLAGWGKGLWPHSGFLGKSVDDVSVGFYQLSRITDDLKIGTFCHETGHSVLRLPDLYDYGSDSRGVGRYDIMGSVSDKNPPPLNAFFRDLCGWENTLDISNHKHRAHYKLAANTNNSLVYGHPFINNESYYIEVRNKNDRSDWLPDEGVLVWHIDFRGSNDFEHRTWYKHYYASVVQADGRYDLENNRNSGDEDDLFDNQTQLFTKTTSPASLWWDGSASGLRIIHISELADTMTISIDSDEMQAFNPLQLSGQVKNGLNLSVIEGEFVRMPAFNDYQIFKEGVVNNLGVTVSGLHENYALQFKGYIKVPQTGKYTFSLSSDDGSIMYLNDRVIIHNSSDLHGTRMETEIELSKGYYKFQLDYFQYQINKGIQLKWTMPDGSISEIPDDMFFIQETPLNIENTELSAVFNFNSKSNLLQSKSEEKLNYAIYGLNGSLLEQGILEPKQSALIHLPDGIYILTMANKETRLVQKILIQ